ncbi:MAG: hypothetical protein ABSF23_11505 [Terracidiphilus sp.]|jgi:hypothetical protein
MAFSVQHPNEFDNTAQHAPVEPENATLVFEELDRILASKLFRNAVRSRQFLEYVVRHKLEGHAEQLKERTIGAEIFQRAPGYATGDDPVVRVQAGEVRRRLEQYYQSLTSRSAVRIELQAGSYSPSFHWPSADSESSAVDHKSPPDEPRRFRIRPVPVVAVGIALVLLVGAGSLYNRFHASKNPPTVEERFWAPVFSTPQPVLICLAKPVVYRPTFDLYQRYTKTHPGSFQTEVERSNQVLPLEANETIRWGDIVPYPDYGVAVGDAYAAVRVSSLLGQIGKPSQVRIGANYSFEDLRNSPSVVVGAFNNRWTMQIMPGLHFSFVEDNGQYMIREQLPGGRVWRATLGPSQQTGDDFAIVARLLDSTTGEFTIVAAGLAGSGTQAAGEFISNPDFLERALRAITPDWQKKNMELVLRTTVTDSVAGPPQVVAVYVW